jgi:hypothetical protein
MTSLLGIIRMDKDRHRLHGNVFILSVICASVSTAFALKAAGKPFEGDVMGFQSHQFDRYVIMPLKGPIEQILKNTVPESIEIRLDEQPKSTTIPTETPLISVLTKIITPTFVEFYEDNLL